MPNKLQITALVHEKLHRALSASATVIDATTGNGHDAVFIVQHLGDGGTLHLIDCQERALHVTGEKVQALTPLAAIHAHCGDHAEVLEGLTGELEAAVSACVFNLGYLPGGDKTITTTREHTLRALHATDRLLSPGGKLSIVCYPGHEEGAREAEAVKDWAEKMAKAERYTLEVYQNSGTNRPGPFLLWLTKQ